MMYDEATIRHGQPSEPPLDVDVAAERLRRVYVVEALLGCRWSWYNGSVVCGCGFWLSPPALKRIVEDSDAEVIGWASVGHDRAAELREGETTYFEEPSPGEIPPW